MAMTKSITGRKTKIRHKTFMPPKMPKVPKMTLPNFCSKSKPEIRAAKTRCEGGPWNGRYVSVRLLGGECTMVFAAGGFYGKYQKRMDDLQWIDKKCA